jgi:outer membrane lipoprotein carrier protein
MVRTRAPARTAFAVLQWAVVGIALFIAAPGFTIAAEKTSVLDAYLQGMTTWSARFSQTVVDARGKSAGAGRGRLIILRPGKFRWESAPEGTSDAVQWLIADGRNLWFYDRDLQQATVKPLQQTLPQSPAMLLAGGADLRRAFRLQPDGKRDGLDWVRVLPRDAQSDFREARFGFKARELQKLVILDKLGQRSTLTFADVQRNRPVEPGLLAFQLPAGVDLIGTPLP